MRNITLRQLEHFVATVEEGAVSKAAQRLHVSAGAVSLALDELESVLRVRLVMRQRGKGITPTVSGRALLVHARRVLSATDSLTNAAASVRGELVGPLSVGCFTALSPWIVPRVMEHFVTRHPSVDLTLVEATWDDLASRLRVGLLDAAFLYSVHAADDLWTQELIEITPRVLLPPDHPLAAQEAVCLDDLRSEPAIMLNIPPSGDVAEAALSAVGFTPQVSFRSSTVETVRSMVARGLGYAITLGRPTDNSTFDGMPLVYREIRDPLPPVAVVVARPAGASPTVKVDALIQATRDAVAEPLLRPDRRGRQGSNRNGT